jgi:hypothetical protein
MAGGLTTPARGDVFDQTWGAELGGVARDFAAAVQSNEAVRERLYEGAQIMSDITREQLDTIVQSAPEQLAALPQYATDQRGGVLVGCAPGLPCLQQPAPGTGRTAVPGDPDTKAGPEVQTVNNRWLVVNSDSYHAGPETDSVYYELEGQAQWEQTAFGQPIPAAGAQLLASADCINPDPAVYKVHSEFPRIFMFKLSLDYTRFCWDTWGFTEYGFFDYDCEVGYLAQLHIECRQEKWYPDPYKRNRQKVLTATPGGQQSHAAGAKFKVAQGVTTPLGFVSYEMHKIVLKMTCYGDGDCWRGRRGSV